MSAGYGQHIAFAMGAGLVCGVAMGLLLGNLLLGIPPGLLLGALIAFAGRRGR